MNQYLYPYQRDGIVFLWNHFRDNHGCILADDMGLGKTIQVSFNDKVKEVQHHVPYSVISLLVKNFVTKVKIVIF